MNWLPGGDNWKFHGGIDQNEFENRQYGYNAGAFGYQDYQGGQDRLQQGAYTAARRGTQQMDSNVAGTAEQSQLGGILMQRALGKGGPSAAELQMKAGLGEAQAGARAQSVGVSNPALAARLAAGAQANMAMQTNQQTGILRAQEQAQATGQAADLYTQQRGQNLQTGQANLEAAIQQQQQRDQMVQYYTSQGLTREQAQMQAGMDLERLRGEQFQAGNATAAQLAIAQAQMRQQSQGGAMSAIGGALGSLKISDENLKEDIKPSGKKLDNFMKALSGFEYKYKKGLGEPGKKFGIMAQDLEKSELGKTLVVETPIGKMVDTGHASLGALAAIARLQKRLEKLEGASA